MMSITHVVAFVLTLVHQVQAAGGVGASFFFFSNQTNALFPDVSSDCNLALTAPIPQCPGEVLSLLSNSDYYTLGNDTVMDTLCAEGCPAAFATYRSNVTAACVNDPQPEPGYPATYYVDAATSMFTQACLKDSQTGMYCTDFFNQTFGEAPDPTVLLGGYSTANLCSECITSLFVHQQSTPYSNYDADSANAWAAIQSHCNLSYPTATPTLQTNVTSLGNYAPSGYATASCLSGRTYTVASGDNCEAIASAQKVSYGSLITLNSLFPDCSNLLGGQQLCLPVSCMSYVVQSGDTCVGIANATGADYQELISWNPTINNYCTNLVAGQNVCVGPPGGYQNFSTITGATVTQTAVYATATVSRPSPVASGTTLYCGRYYLVQPGDYCQLVAINATISLSLFQAINPSIDAACDNLLSGFYYCTQPLQNWNVTVTSSTVTAPTTTPSGTTSNCYQYYTIQSGDYCGKIESQFDITFSQLQTWNPSLLSDCSNLILGDAYCVSGSSGASSATVATTTTASAASTSTGSSVVSAPTTTPSGTTSNCYKYYVIQSGDYCAKIEGQFDITFAQLQSWNPSLLSDCSNLILGDAYCISGPSATTTSANSKIRRTIDIGGVAVGWPGVNSPRMMKAMGFDLS